MQQPPQNELWSGNGKLEALNQVAGLCAKSLNLDVALTPSGEGFASGRLARPRRGIAALTGTLAPQDVIVMEVLLASCPDSLLCGPESS